MDISKEINGIVTHGLDTELLLEEDARWQIKYETSKERRNILDWYPFEVQSSLLEVGAGFGSLTSLFCEKLNKVTALEVNEVNSQTIKYRCKQFDNLEVIAGKVCDINFNETYDYITLIGVLELAEHYADGSDPYRTLLLEIQRLLKPTGTLILAVDNKFGLKNGSRTLSAHDNRKTFTKKELTKLVISCGYVDCQYYYPYPDYNMPNHIFSDEYLPTIGQLNAPPNYKKEKIKFWNDKLVFNDIIEDGNFGYFSNSFLVIVKKGES